MYLELSFIRDRAVNDRKPGDYPGCTFTVLFINEHSGKVGRKVAVLSVVEALAPAVTVFLQHVDRRANRQGQLIVTGLVVSEESGSP